MRWAWATLRTIRRTGYEVGWLFHCFTVSETCDQPESHTEHPLECSSEHQDTNESSRGSIVEFSPHPQYNTETAMPTQLWMDRVAQPAVSEWKKKERVGERGNGERKARKTMGKQIN